MGTTSCPSGTRTSQARRPSLTALQRRRRLRLHRNRLAGAPRSRAGRARRVAAGTEVATPAHPPAGAKVHAEVLEHYRDEKIIVFKYKKKKHYRRKTARGALCTTSCLRPPPGGPQGARPCRSLPAYAADIMAWNRCCKAVGGPGGCAARPQSCAGPPVPDARPPAAPLVRRPCAVPCGGAATLPPLRLTWPCVCFWPVRLICFHPRRHVCRGIGRP
jgi:hypothetical protein